MIFNLFKSPKRLSDDELIDRYKQNGQLKFVGELYQRYAQLISGVCLKYLGHVENAEDAAMDVFEIISRDLKKHEVKNIQNWLFTISKNHSLKLKRKLQKSQSSDNLENLFHDFMELDDNSSLEEKELLEKNITVLENALSNLKEDQKNCVRLFYLKHMSYSEISESTGLELGKVKSHIQNGKRKLKIELEKTIETAR